MLQITPRKIELKLFQRRYNVRLTNLSDMPFIFKIRSTNVKAFTVEPNAGFLRTQTSLSVLITVKSRNPFDERIQISFANITDPTLGYEETWSDLKKKGVTINRQVITVCLNQEQNENSQENEEFGVRSSRSLQKMPTPRKKSLNKKSSEIVGIFGQQQTRKDELSVIKEEKEFKDYITSGARTNPATKEQLLQHYQKEKKRHYQDQEKQELLYRLEELQRKYNNQVNHTERLVDSQLTQKQQLHIAESKIKDSSVQGLKYQVDQTIGAICDQHHTSFTGLALIALAAFFCGYLFALFI